jgi:hypothetical protein
LRSLRQVPLLRYFRGKRRQLEGHEPACAGSPTVVASAATAASAASAPGGDKKAEATPTALLADVITRSDRPVFCRFMQG